MTPKHIAAPRPQGHFNHLLKFVATKTDRVNYTMMEDILEGEQVLTGTFSLNGYPHCHHILFRCYSGLQQESLYSKVSIGHCTHPHMLHD
jgi:hypothetical protein